MKKKLKIIIPVLCFVIVIVAVIGYHSWRNHIPTEIYYIHSDVAHNTDNPRENVGVQTYVFVGYVEETHDYMTEKHQREFPTIITDLDTETTECNVRVIKNIKGNLQEGSTFSFYKDGGISKDRKYIVMHRNDLIPENGKYYIFMGFAHEDGTVTGGGENGTIELESGINAENLENSKLYQEYVDAVENQVSFNKNLYTEFLAKADKNYGDGSHNKQVYQEILKEKTEREEREKANL